MMTACGGSEKDYDATGTFEATETTVFAEQSGALLTFDVEEGNMIEAADMVEDSADGCYESGLSESEARYGTPDSCHAPAVG